MILVSRHSRMINQVVSQIKLVERPCKVMLSGDKRGAIRATVIRKMRFKWIINHKLPPTVSRGVFSILTSHDNMPMVLDRVISPTRK